jgi:caa(3)-type oxidase subunit IV
MSEQHHTDYKKIYFILLGLLVVSVAGPFLGIKWVTLLTAFGIAGVKANLVIQNFMHLREEKMIAKFFLVTSLVLMGLYFFGVAPDVMEHSGQNWENLAAQEAVARGIPEGEHGGEGGDHEESLEDMLAAYPEIGTAAASSSGGGFDAAGPYASVCASCHGAGGAGDGVAAPALNPPPANFTDPAFWAARSDDQVAQAILQGGAAMGLSAAMPAWSAMFDDAQATAMVKYLKTFSN